LSFAASFNFSGGTIFPANIGVGVIIFKSKITFRQRKSLTSDPFLDRTLLYELADGTRWSQKVPQDMVAGLHESFLSRQDCSAESKSPREDKEEIAPSQKPQPQILT